MMDQSQVAVFSLIFVLFLHFNGDLTVCPVIFIILDSGRIQHFLMRSPTEYLHIYHSRIR